MDYSEFKKMVRQMRDFQKAFFKESYGTAKKKEYLRKSKELERSVDQELKESTDDIKQLDLFKKHETVHSIKPMLVSGLTFVATSLDGEQIEMSWSEISTQYLGDDVFYYNNGIGEPVACLFSSLAILT